MSWTTPKPNNYTLSQENKRRLEDLSSKLKPTYTIGGREGISNQIVAKTNALLSKNQLIKVKFCSCKIK